MTDIKMRERLMKERLKDFQKHVRPVELLPDLSCLTKVDKEKIIAESDREGPTIANYTLVDRLGKREHGFLQFVKALKANGLYQVALLLDPEDTVDPAEEEDHCTAADDKGFNIIGTAIDIQLKGFLEANEASDGESLQRLEQRVARRFEEPTTQETRELRERFREFLPRGTAFCHTKQGSVISVVRVSTVAAVEELWQKYETGDLQQKIQELLVDESVSDGTAEIQAVSYRLEFPEEHFQKIHKILEDIEMKSQLDSEVMDVPGDAEGDVDPNPALDEFVFPPVYLENGRPWAPEELKMREYQVELAQQAIEGENTIICAPTNSGKTYVALYIVQEHLRKYKEDKEEGKKVKRPSVIFVVSTVNLVLQQKQRFETYLSAGIADISSANSNDMPLKHVLRNHEVVIITAQILVNNLDPRNPEGLGLSDITMLIFDECHHANKDHAYNKVMERYLAVKMQPSKRGCRLPQVIGFTASLGVGKANKREDARKHIFQICANLDASSVTTVREHTDELGQYVNKPERQLCSAKRTVEDPFEKIIEQVMSKLEEVVKRNQGEMYLAAPPGRSGQQYRQWVETLDKTATLEANRILLTLSEQLREYHIALEINNSTRMQDAVKRLDNYFGYLDDTKMIQTDIKLRNLYKKARTYLEKEKEKRNGFPENPKLKLLRELILDNYPKDTKMNSEGTEGECAKENGAGKTGDETAVKNEEEETGEGPFEEEAEDGPGNDNEGEEEEESQEEGGGANGQGKGGEQPEQHVAKGIVFTRTRESTDALLNWIRDSPELHGILKPEVLVGSGDARIGLTQKEQETVIEKFKRGSCNIILATTVAEEGLDISDCNYVIRYDMMGNEISSVQSRGRVRAKEGKYTVLVDPKSGAQQRDLKNTFREMLMEEAVAQVQKIDPAEFVKQVRILQKKAINDRQLKKNFSAAKKSCYIPHDITFYCRKCHAEACQAHDLRVIENSYHVVMTSDFKDKVDVKGRAPQTFDGVTMNQTIFCKECRQNWGVTVQVNGGEWCCLKISYFALKLIPSSDQLSIFKKWKDAPFHVEPVTPSELLRMSCQNGDADVMMIDDLDLEEDTE